MRAAPLLLATCVGLGIACAPTPTPAPNPYGLRTTAPYLHHALRAHFPELLKGTPLPDSARGIWFIADTAGRVLALGIRPALPDTVAFKALGSLVPELRDREPEQFMLTMAGKRDPAASVAVLWITVKS
jgi:hypothetical protein